MFLGKLDGILDNKMPSDRIPDFEKDVTEYINEIASLGKMVRLAIGRDNNFETAFHTIMPG